MPVPLNRTRAKLQRRSDLLYASAKDFLERYDPARPGCLLLDVRLRGENGLDLQEELRRLQGTLPILVDDRLRRRAHLGARLQGWGDRFTAEAGSSPEAARAHP